MRASPMDDSVGSVLKVLLRDLAGNVAKECCEDLLYEVRDSTLAGVVIRVEIVYLSGYDQGHNPVDYLTIDVGQQIVKARDFAIFGDLKGLSELLPIGGSVSGILYKTSNSQTLVRSMFGLTLLFVEQNLLVQVSVLPSRNGKPYHGKQLIEI